MTLYHRIPKNSPLFNIFLHKAESTFKNVFPRHIQDWETKIKAHSSTKRLKRSCKNEGYWKNHIAHLFVLLFQLWSGEELPLSYFFCDPGQSSITSTHHTVSAWFIRKNTQIWPQILIFLGELTIHFLYSERLKVLKLHGKEISSQLEALRQSAIAKEKPYLLLIFQDPCCKLVNFCILAH